MKVFDYMLEEPLVMQVEMNTTCPGERNTDYAVCFLCKNWTCVPDDDDPEYETPEFLKMPKLELKKEA